MAIKKDLTKPLNILVDHIKENTKDGHFITLTYRDIARLVGTTPGSSVTKRLMESLKEHENILFQLNLDPSKGKKPLQFKFVSKETKYNAIDNRRYQNLTNEEIEFIKDKLGYRDHTELYNILTYVNYLKSMYDGMTFDLPDPKDMSNLLLVLEQDIENMNKFLETYGILIDEKGKYRLFLNHTETGKMLDSKEDNNSAGKTTNTTLEPVNMQRLKSQPSKESLESFLRDLERQQSSLRKSIAQFLIDNLEQTEKAKEEAAKAKAEASRAKKQLEEGHKTLEKILKENQELREKNNKLELELGKLEAKYDKSVRFKDDLIVAAQDFLQIFNWQIQQVALRDSSMSLSEKNSKAYRAKLFQQYVDVGQEFYNSIIGFMKD